MLTDGDLRKELAENGYSRVMERFCSAHNGTTYVSAFLSRAVRWTSNASRPATPAADELTADDQDQRQQVDFNSTEHMCGIAGVAAV